MPQPIRVLFVSQGNHCRSPAAQAVATHIARQRASEHITFDSAGRVATTSATFPNPLASHEGGLRGFHLSHVGRQLHPTTSRSTI
jgi:protein-tyrosine-phosphatase